MNTDDRLDRIDRSLETLTKYVQDQRTDLATLTKYVLDLRTETSHRFEIMDNRLSLLASTFASLDSRMLPFTKALLDFGEVVARLDREQARIARLIDPAA